MAGAPPLKKPYFQSKDSAERVDWKKRSAERKEERKRWKEAKLIKALEKQKSKEQEDQEQQAREEEEAQRKGREYTVSVALPGSVLDNAQSPELRTYLAGQIARACVVFCVDEVVVFGEQGEEAKTVEGEFRGIGKKGQACVQLARILQYLECPQYLRKSFFPKHQDLQFAGLLNPLDSPHHMRIDEDAEFREGVVLQRPSKSGKGSYVNCGMHKEVQIDRQLQAGLRVTVQMNKTHNSGMVLAECPYKEGYDLTIGTSERGSSVDDVCLSPFRHLLVVFGGLNGLEASVDADEKLDITDPRVLFDLYLNTCPGQGSRTIRTEEAILVSLSGLRPKINRAFGKSAT
uniref:28S rRNA (uridine-N(3))-methyltransferase n=1 Tax=Erpetoichthys calabaricus TaxID=27687 RepID=A0A8C4TCI8_ERPCA